VPSLPRALLISLLLAATASSGASRQLGFTEESQLLARGGRQMEAQASSRIGRDYYYLALDGRAQLELGLTDWMQTLVGLQFEPQLENIPRTQQYDLRLLSSWRFRVLSRLTAEGSFRVGTRDLGAGLRLLADAETSSGPGALVLALNLAAFASTRYDGSASTLDLLATGGVAYRLAPTAATGFEVQLDGGYRPGGFLGGTLQLGPTVSFDRGGWWLSFALLAQVGALKPAADRGNGEPLELRRHERFQVRASLGRTL
jgi:hypothetical protein